MRASHGSILVVGLAFASSLALLASLGACGDDSTACDLAADGMCPPGCPTDPDCVSVDGGPPVDNGVAYDDVFAGTCGSTPRCGMDDVLSVCNCVALPSDDARFATNRVGCGDLATEMGRPRTPEDDYCDPGAGSAPPNLTCMMPGMYHVRGAVQMISLYGIVDVFGNGGDAGGILVEVYEEAPDGSLGTMLGSATASIMSPCAESEDEIDNDMVVGQRALGFYSIPNIPTETPLIVKTSGMPDFWRDLYSYNVQILNEEVSAGAAGDTCADIPAGPRHKYRARTLSRSDYQSIPLTAGLPSGITVGNGAVAGEVHDCDDVRLEFAQVGVTPEPTTFVYFNDNPSNPLPMMGRREGTGLLGLYSALDVPPGPVDVTAVGRVGGELVSLGWYHARVYPNAVTAITLRGLRSQQVP